MESAALGGSGIQSGAVGASAGLTEGFNDCETEQSSLLCKFQEASFGFGWFFLFRTTGISMETEQTFKPINSLSCLQ